MTPDRAALVQDGRVTTYADLDRDATRLAHGLRAVGVGRGDRVAFLGLNSVELVQALFATARLGAVLLPLNTRLAVPELAHQLRDAEPVLWLWEDHFADTVEDDGLAGLGGHRHRFVRDAGDGLRGLMAEGDPLDEAVGLDDLLMIQYTSGTSGAAKGVRLSHGNVVWNVVNLLVDVDLTSDEVACVTAPLFHTAALNQVLFPTLLKGGTCLVEPRFDPGRVLELVEEQGVTLLFGVTSMYLALQDHPAFAGADLSTLRGALSGGAPLPESLLQRWADRGVPITQGYGLTEASPGTTMLRAAEAAARIGSAGTPCFFTDVRVVGPDGSPAAPGEPGEVWVQGPNVTDGYWRNPEATAAALDDDGWLRTGDLATLDDEGYLRVVGRLKDMYISGGENVYPAEVEAALHTHPAVAECAVIGVPDERWGEVGRAVVVLREDADLPPDDAPAALLAHLDGRLARYKIPRSVVVAAELPHNASGKLLKSTLKEVYG